MKNNKNLQPNLKQGGGPVMIVGSMSATRPGNHFINVIINTSI